ncbi:Branched-chain amino acid transport system carrier protein [Corynebacterium deserti GIMN1.010]|uniref:Branched-chain amino acid transport system carrier protein n=1 Tax=Corynebacterium deserti GIMN1.010 TaxID=931089 RepID=A0A0M4CMW9_9CORY|nr:branched-chain amino acid transport system II carrier protein [Corynebacterium deserti]ALC06472.1 Branched-chain amino acid transport system carrier protein [Corynebacterium deserti GIMN1.010]
MKKAVLITSLMLFSMFFGAGNLIFPPMLGLSAGTNYLPAIVGFLATGVLLPVLAVIAVVVSGESVRDMASRGGKIFGLVFPILAYLSIGAFYALPRTGAVSYSAAVGVDNAAYSGIFNFVFFAVALALSWNPNGVADKLGKWLTPALLILIVVLVGLSYVTLDGTPGAPTGAYAQQAAGAGLLEGYMTMDAIAALAFGIVVISAFKYQKVRKVRTATVMAATIAGVLLALVYLGLGSIGQRVIGEFADGTAILNHAAHTTMGEAGRIIFVAILILACMTTAVGLISATSEFFNSLLPGISYHVWAVLFALMSFGVATMGLDTVLALAAPVIGFIYPSAITLVALTLIEPLLFRFKWTYLLGIWMAVVWALFMGVPSLVPYVAWAPLHSMSLGWVIPVVIAATIGLVMDGNKKATRAVGKKVTISA